MWKPAIDSLGGILGVENRPYFPKDDRIVRLGLHRTVDPAVGWGVHLGVWWRVADDSERAVNARATHRWLVETDE